jgi:hypothetical protein
MATLSNTEKRFWEVFGNKDIVRLIHSKQKGKAYKDWTDGDLAARRGYLELIKAKAAEGAEMKFSTDAMDQAAGKGYLDVVKWLHENRTEGCTHWAIDQAIEYGHLDVVKYLYSIGKRYTSAVFVFSEPIYDDDIKQWLKEHPIAKPNYDVF